MDVRVGFCRSAPPHNIRLPCKMLVLRRRGSLLQAAAGACCSSVVVAVGLPLISVCVCAAGWGLHLRTETSGPTSTPSLAFEFYPIRLLIWSWTRMWDFASPCPPQKNLPLAPVHFGLQGFRVASPHLFPRFLPPALQRCKDEHVRQGCSSCALLVFPSPDPASLRCGLLGSSFLALCVCRGLLLQWCCCTRTSVDELWCATGSGFRGLVCQSNK